MGRRRKKRGTAGAAIPDEPIGPFIANWKRFITDRPWMPGALHRWARGSEQLELFPKRTRLGPSSILRALWKNRRIPNALLEIELPSFPKEWTNEEVGLKRRFRFALALREVREGELTLRCALSIPRFGFRGIVSYLTAYCRFPGLLRGFEEATEYDPRLAKRVVKLIRSMDDWSVSKRDPRFGRRIRDQVGNRGSWLAHIARAAGASIAPLPQTCSAAEFRMLVDDLIQTTGRTLENDFEDVCCTSCDKRRREILRRYYGLKGRRPRTLEEIGQEYGLTRERVRQLLTMAREAISTHGRRSGAFCPTADTVATQLSALAPVLASKAEKKLARQGLIGTKTRMETVLLLLEKLQRQIAIRLDKAFGIRFVGTDEQISTATAAIDVCYDLISRSGAVQVGDVLEQLPQSIIPRRVLVSILTKLSGFCWLNRGAEWFWIDGRYFPLRDRIKRVLSVAPCLKVSELRAAVRKDYHIGTRVPPLAIFYELCRHLPEVVVGSGEMVCTREFIEPSEVLRGDEATLVGLFEKNGPLCRGDELRKQAKDSGISGPSFWRCLLYSPCIARLANGVYSLVGAEIPPGMIESIAPRRSPTRIVEDHGWTSRGELWIAYRVSDGVLNSGVLSVPTAKQSYIQGEFDIISPEFGRDGTLIVKGPVAWGIGPFLRRRSVEVGDILLVRFNPMTRVAELLAGGEEILDEVLSDS